MKRNANKAGASLKSDKTRNSYIFPIKGKYSCFDFKGISCEAEIYPAILSDLP